MVTAPFLPSGKHLRTLAISIFSQLIVRGSARRFCRLLLGCAASELSAAAPDGSDLLRNSFSVQSGISSCGLRCCNFFLHFWTSSGSKYCSARSRCFVLLMMDPSSVISALSLFASIVSTDSAVSLGKICFNRDLMTSLTVEGLLPSCLTPSLV